MRRNLKSQPPLPEEWELLAVAYGTGPDDYLGVVLAVLQRDEPRGPKYATWSWNSDFGCEGVALGHYFEGTDNRYPDRQSVYAAAWANFVARANLLVRRSCGTDEIAGKRDELYARRRLADSPLKLPLRPDDGTKE